MPQTAIRRYKSEAAMQRDVVRMGESGWNIVSQSSYTPKKGFIRWMLGGFIFFNRRPEHMVTFQAADGAVMLPEMPQQVQVDPAQVLQLKEQGREAYAAHKAALNPLVRYLRRKPIAWATFGVYAILAILAFATSWTWPMVVVTVALVGLAAIDWEGLSTLDGHITWPAYRAAHPRLYGWAIAALIIFFPFTGALYLLECAVD